MAVEVYQDSLATEIVAVESVSLDPSSSESLRCYPHLALRSTQEVREITFDTLVLENEFLRTVFVPALGGRILSIVHKGSGLEVLRPPRRLTPEPGGRRGVHLPVGIECRVGDAPESMARVSALMEEAEDESAAGAIWIASSTGPLSYHIRYELEPESATISAEARVFNRSWRPQPYAFSILVHGFEQASSWLAWSGSEGVAVSPEEPLWQIDDQRGLTLERAAGAQLMPHQIDSFRFEICPFVGVPQPLHAGVAGVLSLDGGRLRLCAFKRSAAAKVLLLCNGETLEAAVDLDPAGPLDLDLGGRQPSSVVVLTADRQETLRWEAHGPSIGNDLGRPTPDSVPESYLRAVSLHEEGKDAAQELAQHPLHLGTRSATLALQGVHFLRSGLPEAAAQAFEDALLYNAEDHLAWWMRAVSVRLAAGVGEERPELLNAHYLAPLEPALRAEGFLAQGAASSEPSPLVEPLRDQPENFIVVACLLLEMGQIPDAMRWLDEALRHEDLLMLRYLLAYTYLQTGRMEIEAADQMSRAALMPLAPPFPWRPVEAEALRALSARYPSDERLALLSRLARDSVEKGRG